MSGETTLCPPHSLVMSSVASFLRAAYIPAATPPGPPPMMMRSNMTFMIPLFQFRAAEECGDRTPIVIILGGRAGLRFFFFLWRCVFGTFMWNTERVEDASAHRLFFGWFFHARHTDHCAVPLRAADFGESRRDDGNFHFVLFEFLIAYRAEDYFCMRVYGFGDGAGGILYLKHAEVVVAGNGKEHAFCAGNRDFKEGRIDGEAGGFFGTLIA